MARCGPSFNYGVQYRDDHHMQTEKPPKILIYKKKEKDPKTGKRISYFFIEEPKKPLKRFKTFNDVIDFFDTYKQEELTKEFNYNACILGLIHIPLTKSFQSFSQIYFTLYPKDLILFNRNIVALYNSPNVA